MAHVRLIHSFASLLTNYFTTLSFKLQCIQGLLKPCILSDILSRGRGESVSTRQPPRIPVAFSRFNFSPPPTCSRFSSRLVSGVAVVEPPSTRCLIPSCPFAHIPVSFLLLLLDDLSTLAAASIAASRCAIQLLCT